MTTVHEFHESLAKSEEPSIDRILENLGYRYVEVGKKTDRSGIDRWIVKDGIVETVDYKCDYMMAKTGNVPIEIKHVADDGSGEWVGWAYKPRAHKIVFLNYYGNEMISIPQAVIQENVDAWAATKLKYAQNKGKNNRPYKTYNAVIPIKEIVSIPGVVRVTLEESLRGYRPPKRDWTRFLHTDLAFGKYTINPPDADGIIRRRRHDNLWRYAPGDPGYVQYRDLFVGTQELMRMGEFLERHLDAWKIQDDDDGTRLILCGESISIPKYTNSCVNDKMQEFTDRLARSLRQNLEGRARALHAMIEHEKNLGP